MIVGRAGRSKGSRLPDGTPLTRLLDKGPPNGPVIVLLHGRGSTEDDLLPLGRMMHPDATTIALRAPFDAAPWGYGSGYAWYRFLHGTHPEPTSFESGQHALDEALAQVTTALERPDRGFFLGGFSQGGTTALAWTMRHPRQARGILVFSGFLADHPTVEPTRGAVRGMPIYWGHGAADPMVPFVIAAAGWRKLREVGADLDARSYSGMGHTISEVELRDASQWLAERLTHEASVSAAGDP